MAAPPEKLAPGIYRVDGLFVRHALSLLLIAGSDGWTLIDTGLASSVRRIQRVLAALGAGPDDLKRVYLTHHHSDHIGGLPGLVAWAPRVEVIAPAREAPIVAGERPPDRRENPVLQFLTERQRLPAAPVTRTAREGDSVGGFRAIATPGHTRGHTSLLHEEHGLLMTGDAFGQLLRRVEVGVNRHFCTDPALARRSSERLIGYDVATVVMSHGPVLYDGARARLLKAVARRDWA